MTIAQKLATMMKQVLCSFCFGEGVGFRVEGLLFVAPVVCDALFVAHLGLKIRVEGLRAFYAEVGVAQVLARPTNAEVSVAQVLAKPIDAKVNVAEVHRCRGQCSNNPTNPYH